MLDGKRGHLSWLLIMACALSSSIIVSSCSEQLTGIPPGASLVNREIIILDTTIFATGSSSFKQYVPMDSRIFPLSQNLLGRFGNYTAFTVLQFNPNFI
ncbi:MAG: hypothetical protein HY708_01545, partial [Ignavibacteriae bacterium]|nr:hypothetical protein [Ignavibacteriota bacterium]